MENPTPEPQSSKYRRLGEKPTNSGEKNCDGKKSREEPGYREESPSSAGQEGVKVGRT